MFMFSASGNLAAAGPRASETRHSPLAASGMTNVGRQDVRPGTTASRPVKGRRGDSVARPAGVTQGRGRRAAAMRVGHRQRRGQDGFRPGSGRVQNGARRSRLGNARARKRALGASHSPTQPDSPTWMAAKSAKGAAAHGRAIIVTHARRRAARPARAERAAAR